MIVTIVVVIIVVDSGVVANTSCGAGAAGAADALVGLAALHATQHWMAVVDVVMMVAAGVD